MYINGPRSPAHCVVEFAGKAIDFVDRAELLGVLICYDVLEFTPVTHSPPSGKSKSNNICLFAAFLLIGALFAMLVPFCYFFSLGGGGVSPCGAVFVLIGGGGRSWACTYPPYEYFCGRPWLNLRSILMRQ